MARRLLSAILLLGIAAAPAAGRASSWLRPLLLKNGSYGESFTFIADLDDGTYVQATLSFTNLGPGSTKGLCRGLVVRPDGATWKASTRVGKDEYAWRGGGDEKLAVGPCSAWVDADGTGVEVPLEGGAVRLVFSARPSTRAARATDLVVGDARFQTDVLLAHVPVAATLSTGGEPPRRASGGGYADHTRSTCSPRDLARGWVRFRALRGERALILLGRRAPDGKVAPLWACEDGRCRDYASFEVARGGGDAAPTFQVAITGAEGHIDLRSGRLLYRDAPVEDLGVLGRLVMPFTGNPVTYVYRARADEGGAAAPVDGVLEVDLGSE